MELPLTINQVQLVAIPDTESVWNAMDEVTAKKLKLAKHDHPADRRDFQIGNSSYITSTGRVTVDLAFSNETTVPMRASFFIFRKITTNIALILGSKFLDATETLTKYTERLRKRSDIPPLMPRFNLIGSSQRRFRCYINSVMVSASADTGSDLNLISPNYAVQRGFSFQSLDKNDAFYVEVVGGSIVPLSGKIHLNLHTLKTVNASPRDSVDSEGDASRSHASTSSIQTPTQRTAMKCFYMLWNLSVPVVLGEELLDSIDAFTCHAAAYIDVPPNDMSPQLRTIQSASCISRFRKRRKRGGEACTQVSKATKVLVESDAVEIHRQETAAKEIFKLEELEASASDQAEKKSHKQQRENLITRNEAQIAAYRTERKKAEMEITKQLAAAKQP